MKKSLSSHSLNSLPKQVVMRNSVSCNSLATMATDLVLEQQIELITHAPAYKVGMCMAQEIYEFPRGIVTSPQDLSENLISCVMTPDDSDSRPIYEFPCKYKRLDCNSIRAGELLMRRRRKAWKNTQPESSGTL